MPGASIRNKSVMNSVQEAKAPPGCSLSSHPARGILAVELPDCGVPEPRHGSKGRDVMPGRLSHSQQSGLSLFCVSVCRALISKEGSGELSSRQVLNRGAWEEEGAGFWGRRLAVCFSKGGGGVGGCPVQQHHCPCPSWFCHLLPCTAEMRAATAPRSQDGA